MMKRRLSFLLCILLVWLCACSEKPSEEQYGTLSGLYESYAGNSRAEIGFLMEATFSDTDSGQTGVLYFIQGEAQYDRASDLAHQNFTATLLAATYTSEEYYASGKKIHLESGEVYELETTKEAFFDAFPYCEVPMPAFSAVKSLQEKATADGTLYILTSSEGQAELLNEVWQLDLYALAGITVPDYEKESYGDVTYTFSVKDGSVRSLEIRMTVSVYETPAYTPGYTAKSEDYRLDLTLTAKVTLKTVGDAVEIPQYGEADA